MTTSEIHTQNSWRRMKRKQYKHSNDLGIWQSLMWWLRIGHDRENMPLLGTTCVHICVCVCTCMSVSEWTQSAAQRVNMFSSLDMQILHTWLITDCELNCSCLRICVFLCLSICWTAVALDYWWQTEANTILIFTNLVSVSTALQSQ